MIKNKMGALAGCAILAFGLAACGSSTTTSSSSSTPTTASSSSSATISGAGSTFAAPVYEQWASAQSGLTVNYQPVGSGAGITALESKTVDFGASDPPLKPADEEAIAKNGSPAVQIPMFLGAITVSYNVPGLKTGLKLEGKTIAEHLPRQDQDLERARNQGAEPRGQPAEHGDHGDPPLGLLGHDRPASPSFLSDVDPEWKSKVGEGKTVQWPTGTGEKGNAGVAGGVEQTTGAVGYVEQAYALTHNFTVASVKNKAGKFVAPTLASTSAAGEGVTVPANLGIKVINPPAASAYPITSQTFIVVNKDLCKAGIPGGEAAAKGVVKFLDYGLGAGPGDPLEGRLRGAAVGDPRQVQRSGRGPAVQRHGDRLTMTRRPRLR